MLLEGVEARPLLLNGGVALTEKLLGLAAAIGLDGELAFERGEAGMGVRQLALGTVEVFGALLLGEVELALEIGDDPGAVMDGVETVGGGGGELVLAQAGGVELGLEAGDKRGALVDVGEAFGGGGGEFVLTLAGGGELGLEIGDERGAFVDGDETFGGGLGKIVVALLEGGNLGLEAGNDLRALLNGFETFGGGRFNLNPAVERVQQSNGACP